MTMPTVLEGRLSLPVIASPMFIVSGPELVIAQCKQGIVGSFPALNARPISQLDEWLFQIKSELADYAAANPDKKVAPFAVNQIVHASNTRLEEDVALCVKHEVPIIITSLRAPNEIVEAIHSYGGIILHDVTTIRHAQKALEAGVDGLILVCAGAGGHAGRLSPFALVSEVRQFFDGPIALSGAIANGRSILAAQAMGADLAYMGSAFIATKEANAVDDYKNMIVESTGEDILYTNTFTGVHGNYLRPSVEKAGLDPENLPGADKSRMNFGSGSTGKSKAWKDIWGSGQGIGSVSDVPSVEEYVDRLKEQYAQAKAEINNKAI
ncbi:NAD(P)H-dependent flavin oxidoreductase [Sneathiella sp. HT1-7]|uniref:NAD(P)H-dependent flavin oxidoreductase n=1 Tax=Sneathiella sp. HT1-7 TaxID=2887192 RepID=UPI001D1376AF|nr:nitronate monooxygenase family protein [Sneathiella sp. HT1-7]MCC3306590.1 nitronate monooxygenase family protein [Sneathiella sp. HT1-7]